MCYLFRETSSVPHTGPSEMSKKKQSGDEMGGAWTAKYRSDQLESDVLRIEMEGRLQEDGATRAA